MNNRTARLVWHPPLNFPESAYEASSTGFRLVESKEQGQGGWAPGESQVLSVSLAIRI